MRLLMSLVFGAVSLAAQSSLSLQLAALPAITETRVGGARPGGLVGLVLGLETGHVPLPGSVALELLPITLASLALADGDGIALLNVSYAAGSAAGLAFFAQAIALDPAIAFGLPGSVLVSPLRQTSVPVQGEPADLVVLFGQSNAEGTALVTELPAHLRRAHPSTRIWSHVAAAWQPLEAGVNAQLLPNSPIFGPEMGIAERAAALPRPLWLVKVAVASSSLGPTPGPFNEWGVAAGELYPLMLQSITGAAAAASAHGYAPRVRLICMMQGESDCVSTELALQYEQRLTALLDQLRADLRSAGLEGQTPPTIRIGLVGSMLARLGLPGTKAVRAAQSAVATALARCETIETDGLALMVDRIHLAAAGLLELGRAFVAVPAHPAGQSVWYAR